MIYSKRISVFVMLLFFMSQILLGQRAYPRIIIDDYYSHIKQKGDSAPSHKYQVEASKGLIIDATKYDFSKIKQLNNGNDPDFIHIVCNSGTFIIKLNLNQPTIVNKTTVQNVSGNGKFNGFQKGDTPIIGIGSIEKTGSKSSLLTFWVSLIEVR